MVPAAILVLACCMAGMQLAAEHLRLQDAAASAARSVARGDSLSPAAGLVPRATLRAEDRGEVVCVTASAPGSIAGGLFGTITVTAWSCALDGGR